MDRDDFQALLAPHGQRLLGRIAEETGGEPVSDTDLLPLAKRLRRDYHPGVVAVAITQAQLRVKARAKFGADATRMYFTPDGLQQATHGNVATHRAARYRQRTAENTVDLCCGVGSDLIALARAGCRVTGIDSDPLTVDVARANIAALGLAAPVQPTGLAGQAAARAGDATDADMRAYRLAFCDPSRRTGHARTLDPAAYTPPLVDALRLASQAGGGAVKVAPGIPHEVVPSEAEAEWVSDHGELKEATLWVGELASDVTRRATLLPSGHTLAGDPDRASPAAGHPRRYLYEPDGAILRAGLVSQVARAVDGTLIDPTIAYITADRYVPTPYARAYEITDALPFSLKRLRALLRSRRVGTATIKKRGSAVDVERLRRDLRLSGPEQATVVLTRVDGAPYAFLCTPKHSLNKDNNR